MRTISVFFIGAISAVVLAVASIWLWQNARYLSLDMTRPEVARYAVFSASVAICAAAQVVLITCVVGNLYRQGLFDRVFKFLAAGIGMVSLVSAVALGLAGR